MGLCLLGGLRPSTLPISRLFLVGMNVVGLCSSNEKTLPSFNFEGLPLTSASCSRVCHVLFFAPSFYLVEGGRVGSLGHERAHLTTISR